MNFSFVTSLSLASKPAKYEQIFLLDNANLSGGGDSVDVTSSIDSFYKKSAIQITKDMGLRLCGVDIMIDEDGDGWHVIEINSAPGLDHYAAIGAKQNKIVEDLYLQVLKAMDTDA